MKGKLDSLFVQERVMGVSQVMVWAEGNGSLGATLPHPSIPRIMDSLSWSSPISSHATVGFLLPWWSSFSELQLVSYR